MASAAAPDDGGQEEKPPGPGDDAAEDEDAAALPDLDHLTMRDFYDIYEPSDDTFLLMDAIAADKAALRALRPRLAVEIGSGSGCATAVLARTLARALGGPGPNAHRTLFLATDLNPKAARATAGTGAANSVAPLEVVQGDLLTSLQPRLEGLVDVLVFNPPYVPTPPEEIGGRGIEAAWAGGKDGREVTDRLLPDVPRLLSPRGGVMYLVAVQDNKPEELLALMRARGLAAEVLRTRKARNEVLSILKFTRLEREVA